MRFSNAIALNLNPLMFRMLLALTFLWAGTVKFDFQEYTGEDAKILIDLGIAVASAPATPSATPPAPAEEVAPTPPPTPTPPETETIPSEPTGDDEEREMLPAGEEGDHGEAEAIEPPTSEESTEEAVEPVPDVDVSTLKVQAREMHDITLMLHHAGHPAPRIMAWVAACTEVGGAILLIIGMFSRVWGLGLAITMGYAFYLTTWSTYSMALGTLPSPLPLGWWEAIKVIGLETARNGFFQLALGAMAFSVFLSGPGAVSLDRLIFRPKAGESKLISEMDA